jgi:hypothetical protein
MDVVIAFLNVDVVFDIYMENPEGSHVPSSSGTLLVYKLDKALYGIHEARRNLNSLFTSWLVSFGFSRSFVDHVLSIITSSDLLYILFVNVDDCLLVG